MSVTDHPGFQASLRNCTVTEGERIIAAVREVEAQQESASGPFQYWTTADPVPEPSHPDQAQCPTAQEYWLLRCVAAAHLQMLHGLFGNSSPFGPPPSETTAGEIMRADACGVHPAPTPQRERA